LASTIAEKLLRMHLCLVLALRLVQPGLLETLWSMTLFFYDPAMLAGATA